MAFHFKLKLLGWPEVVYVCEFAPKCVLSAIKYIIFFHLKTRSIAAVGDLALPPGLDFNRHLKAQHLGADINLPLLQDTISENLQKALVCWSLEQTNVLACNRNITLTRGILFSKNDAHAQGGKKASFHFKTLLHKSSPKMSQPAEEPPPFH